MEEITLEKIDIIRERLGVTYSEAREALEAAQGNLVDALIYSENNKKSKIKEICTTKEEFLNWIKGLIQTGSVTRIKIKKDNKILADIPVNAGVVITGLTLWLAPLVFGGSILAVFALKLSIEITKNDGSVEVVNTIIKDTVTDMKDKVTNAKDVISDIAAGVKEKITHKASSEEDNSSDNVYKYTVKFEDLDESKTDN
ncbi:MAG: DUF4342 domain-containing protein [Bacillota bacterium]|nr:DUF4342 domain-containing protein [Bacillota bacterium]